MLKEVGLAIMLIIYLMAAYTICGIVGLGLHFPFRNCELEGSIVDVGVLKQAQAFSDRYYIDRNSGNFYPIVCYSKILNGNNFTYSYSKGKIEYHGVISLHKLYVEDTRTWWDAIWSIFSSIKSFLEGIYNIIVDVWNWLWEQIAGTSKQPGMEYLSTITKPVYANPEFEFCYVTPQVILIDCKTSDGGKPGEFYVVDVTNYIKASTK